MHQYSLCEESSKPPDDGGDYVPVEYTRTLNKAYRFFHDGHVQEIRYHPMLEVPNCVCIAAVVLPSMRKNCFYTVCTLMHQATARVIRACCTCPAGLLGCCNHVTATLYCLEDYIHCSFQEDERKGCTDRLQTWNQPRKNLDARPTDDVKLVKHEYGMEKSKKFTGSMNGIVDLCVKE